jgi:hypothetical protein
LPNVRSVLPPEYPHAPEVVPFGEGVLESIVASFVARPHDIACARQHAQDILRLADALGPEGVGAACRRLLMFLARSSSCRCDYVDLSKSVASIARRPDCLCERKLEMDPRKEYARVLFFAVFKATSWSPDDRAVFLVEACKFRFSALVYHELAACLDAIPAAFGEPLPNPDARPYTLQEKKDAYDLTDSAVQHAGCAEVRTCFSVISSEAICTHLHRLRRTTRRAHLSSEC